MKNIAKNRSDDTVVVTWNQDDFSATLNDTTDAVTEITRGPAEDFVHLGTDWSIGRVAGDRDDDGKVVHEWVDLVGARLTASDIEKIIDEVIKGDGVAGVELTELSSDGFSIEVTGKHGTDTFVFEGSEVAELLADDGILNTRNSAEEIVFLSADELRDAEATAFNDPMFIGDNNGSGSSETNPMQEVAALVGDDIRISESVNNIDQLIQNASDLPQVDIEGVGDDVVIRLFNEKEDTTDVIVVEDYQQDPLNPRNSADEFYFLSEDAREAAALTGDPLKIGINVGQNNGTNAVADVAAVVGGDIRISDNVNDVDRLVDAFFPDVAVDSVYVEQVGADAIVEISNDRTGATDTIFVENFDIA